jgi:hypothetical protein
MANWLYQKNGTKHGPIDSAKLKQLARTGELRPDDLLRRDDMQSWTKASKVQGLFGAAIQVVTQQPPTASVPNPSPANDSPVATAQASTTDSTTGGRKSKLVRNVIIGVVVLLVIGFIVHVVDLRKMNATYAEATRLWDAGQKQEALALYGTLKDREELRDEKRQVLFQRLVDHEVASGSMDAARQLLQQAVQAGVVVTPSTSEGQKLFAMIQAEVASEGTAKGKGDVVAKAAEEPLPLFMVGQPFKGEARVLSAAHLPAFPNKRRVFEELWYNGKQGRIIGKNRVEHTCDGDGKVTITWTTSADGITGSRTDTEQLSRTADFVELGERLRIKIGAKEHDSWPSRTGDAEFEYVRTEESTATLAGGKSETLLTAVIIKRPTAPTPPDENATKEEWKVVEGSGITSYKMMVLDRPSAYYFPAIEQRLQFSVDVK